MDKFERRFQRLCDLAHAAAVVASELHAVAKATCSDNDAPTIARAQALADQAAKLYQDVATREYPNLKNQMRDKIGLVVQDDYKPPGQMETCPQCHRQRAMA
jgi:hypothetical protein